MYFVFILIIMASYISDDEEYSSLCLTQESREINIMDISSEDDGDKTNFELLLESARELSTSQISNFDDKIFGMEDNSQLSVGNESTPSSPIFVPSSRPAKMEEIEVCNMSLPYLQVLKKCVQRFDKLARFYDCLLLRFIVFVT